MIQNGECKAYQKLCTEFYDITRPEAGPKEIRFYEQFISNAQGPILEAMCGSGRLLVPLLKLGYKIDGVDNSDEMLASCIRRCQDAQLETNLYNQSLQTLSLPVPYSLIFIAAGSFQLFQERTAALNVLQALYCNLKPGGVLLLDTFIPWGTINECIDGDVLSNKKRTITSTRRVTTPDGSKITMTANTLVDPQEQLEICHSRYEKILNKEIIDTENEQLNIRWYYRYEMELFLEKAGFSVKKIWDTSNELDAQVLIYEAIKGSVSDSSISSDMSA